MADYEDFPPAPIGYEACRVMLTRATLTHLVELDERGRNGGRPTVCGLTRFDRFDDDSCPIPDTADLPGWGLGDSGQKGPNVEQVRCDDCYAKAVGCDCIGHRAYDCDHPGGPRYLGAPQVAPWDRADGCFGHCDPEGWYAPCRDPKPTDSPKETDRG